MEKLEGIIHRRSIHDACVCNTLRGDCTLSPPGGCFPKYPLAQYLDAFLPLFFPSIINQKFHVKRPVRYTVSRSQNTCQKKTAFDREETMVCTTAGIGNT